jgi:hypothetical protein
MTVKLQAFLSESITFGISVLSFLQDGKKNGTQTPKDVIMSITVPARHNGLFLTLAICDQYVSFDKFTVMEYESIMMFVEDDVLAQN